MSELLRWQWALLAARFCSSPLHARAQLAAHLRDMRDPFLRGVAEALTEHEHDTPAVSAESNVTISMEAS